MLKTILAIATVAALTASTSPAEAITNDALHDAGGAVNGCHGSLDPLVLGVDPLPTPNPSITSVWRISCPESAGVLRITSKIAIDVRQPNGTWKNFANAGGGSTTGLPGPSDYTGAGSYSTGCAYLVSLGLAPGHLKTIRVRNRIATKTTRDNSDPNPFVTQLAQQVKVTC